MDKAKDIEAALREMADERQASILRRFFKTGPGQYGAGDKFLGLKNPQVRAVVREAWRTTPLSEAVELAQNPWHEIRLCGLLIMVAQFEKAASGTNADEARMKLIFDTYLSLHPYINNWDLVDLTAYKIAGRYSLRHPESAILEQWIQPEFTLWQRRISMVSTWIAIHHGQFEQAFRRAEVLMRSNHDLLHKAAGWMLREVYKHGGEDQLEAFLETNVSQMPATMLSYATEKMPLSDRRYWQIRRRGENSSSST